MQAIIGNRLVAALKPDTRPYEVLDSKLKAFLIRVQPSGVMSYICEYGRGRRITLGKVGVLTPAQARDKAVEILADVARGIDPLVAKKAARVDQAPKVRFLDHDEETRWKVQTPNATGLVFPGKDGDRLDNVKSAWCALLKSAGIVNFRWHDMRHHFASRLVMAGVDLNTLREFLGHGDIKMTLRYAHLAPEHKAAAVARLVQGAV